MQFYPHRTVDEQAERLPEQLREAYKNSQLDRITIFDGITELEVTGYAEYSYLEEKSYKTQPVRTQEGVVEDLDEYATFLTPRLIIKYNMMGIEDYRSLMKMLKNKNSFRVKCYDVVEDKIVLNDMYHATPSMPIIYQQYLIALGIQEYTIELIGTNKKYEFYIDSTKYYIAKGAKWEDFCFQNPEDFYINEYGEVMQKFSYVDIPVHYDDGTDRTVHFDELIIEGDKYYTSKG